MVKEFFWTSCRPQQVARKLQVTFGVMFRAAFAAFMGTEMAFESMGLNRDAQGSTESPAPGPRVRIQSRMKRAMDLVLASFGLVFIAPLMIPIAIAIRLHDGGPAIFVQSRIGRDGKEFRCFKFRTMVVDADKRLEELLETDPRARREWSQAQKLSNDPRITRFGRFLRKSSLDELPQLFNILKGEMSVVGPRPIVRSEVIKYGSYFDYYKGAKPGLTGLWQISGRSDTSYDERVALDVAYVEHWSLLQDAKIIALTLPAIVASKGAR